MLTSFVFLSMLVISETVSQLFTKHVLILGENSLKQSIWKRRDEFGCARKCHKYAICVRTMGSFTCMCKRGFIGTGTYCIDIKECAWGLHNCHGHATCKNTIGSFTCTCKHGFFGNGKYCSDINECAIGIDNCHVFATCNNTIGSFTCTCRPGSTGNGKYCSDMNGCPRDCGRYAQCTNTINFPFGCRCRQGFFGTGKLCYDIDECKRGFHNCHHLHAECINTKGNFKCKCKKGYRGPGHTCTAIKHCLESTHDCSEYAGCTDLAKGGDYKCDCKFGFFGSGKTCTGSRGTRFLVLFMKNIMDPTHTSSDSKHAEIYIASVHKTDIKISTSASLSSKLKSQIDRRVSMKPNSDKIFNITFEIRVDDFQVQNKAIMVETTGITSVFALNYDGYTSDSTLILPTDRLGTKYIVPTTVPYDSRHSDYNSQIAFAAVKDRTRVTVVLKLRKGESISYLGKRYVDGGKIIVNLNKYQTFQLSHNGDMTGTMISSSKPVAVSSGNRCNKLNRFGYCSHLVEQIPPVESLDKIYVVPPHVERSGTHVRVVAAHSGSTTFTYSVDKSKKAITVGTYGNFDKNVNGNQAVVIEAKRQVLVLSFGLGARRSKNGDPYMTMVPGVDQYVHQYHIAVPQGFDANYFAIIVKKSSKQSLRVDNASINSSDVVSESTVTVRGTEYTTMAVKTTKGVHRVETTDKSRFGLMVYGHGRDDSYGFAANILGPGKI